MGKFLCCKRVDSFELATSFKDIAYFLITDIDFLNKQIEIKQKDTRVINKSNTKIKIKNNIGYEDKINHLKFSSEELTKIVEHLRRKDKEKTSIEVNRLNVNH